MEVKNSNLLDAIIEHIKNGFEPDETTLITEEHFILSVLDFITGKVEYTNDNTDDKLEMIHLIILMMCNVPMLRDDEEKLREMLTERVTCYRTFKNEKTEFFSDGHLLENHIKMAKKNLPFFSSPTPSMVLESIFRQPSVYVASNVMNNFRCSPQTEYSKKAEISHIIDMVNNLYDFMTNGYIATDRMLTDVMAEKSDSSPLTLSDVKKYLDKHLYALSFFRDVNDLEMTVSRKGGVLKNFLEQQDELQDIDSEGDDDEDEDDDDENEDDDDNDDEDEDCDYESYDNEYEFEITPEEARSELSLLTLRVKNMYDELRDEVFGQENAVSIFTSGYFRSELLAMTEKHRVRPRAAFLFAGPPGVGKTFLAEKAAQILEMPFKRFDMSEYSDKEANLAFCGTGKVYKNSYKGNVTGFVAKHPKCVLLFDEIEKAHINIIHLFLQLLDAGRLRDNYTEKEVSFKDAIVILTTNAGRQLYEETDAGDFSRITRKVVLDALEKDINPEKGVPFFPQAICSRFASGNVVMFNRIGSGSLREIAKREILRHACNFEQKMGIKVSIDEQVYTALLFAEGGTADARTIRSRAGTFFDDELFELCRLMASEKAPSCIENLEKISISVDLPRDNEEIMSLFVNKEKCETLIYASKKICSQCAELCPDVDFTRICNTAMAKFALHDKETNVVLIDLLYRRSANSKYLNIEDVESEARDLFRFIRNNYTDIPVYILQQSGNELNAEEQISLLRQGASGFITLSGNDEDFSEDFHSICETIHQQHSTDELARANKLITFETAQVLKNKGKSAEIRLFDFDMAVAVSAEDAENILSKVSKPDVRFDQVIGANDAKKELMYFVEYLKNPKKYIGTGVSAPKGVLLYGPSGTGKTMLAKAMACESDVTFIATEGNSFLKKYVGEGSEKVHELFRTARKYAPSILFIDEIDAIAKERKGDASGSEATLTAFLAEMDGFKNDSAKPVFVLAATNFDVEPGGSKSLDPALMRRFDRRVYIDLPNRADRKKYISVRLSENSMFDISDETVNSIAQRSAGMSLAELGSFIELALRNAVRDGTFKVNDAAFEETFDEFNDGEEKKWNLPTQERTARHEAGHTLLCWLSGNIPPYVTIVSRGNYGGYMQNVDNEGKMLYTKEELLSRIRTCLGGRAAEIVYYGEKDGLSTGASGDLTTATNIARNIICSYGMDDSFGMAVVSGRSSKSSELNEKIRTAVNGILADEMSEAIRLIESNKPAIDALSDALMKRSHLNGAEISSLLEKYSPEKDDSE